MSITLIDDIRSISDFKGNTFSNFKKADVKKQLELNLNQGKIEPAYYWATEFICAGQYSMLWDILINFYFKHVHVGNIKACVYLQNRLSYFEQMAAESYKDNQLHMRNSVNVRTLFCEVICVFCESKRNRPYTEVKIKPDEFDLLYNDKLRATAVGFADDTIKENDPKEFYVAVNEFAYNLSSNVADYMMCCYWLEWVMAYNTICGRDGIINNCHTRHFPPVDYKYKTHVIWLLWHAIIVESRKRCKLFENIIQDSFAIYCFQFGIGCLTKRKSILYFALAVLTEPISLSEPIIGDKYKLSSIIENIDHIYEQIKNSEHSTHTDYLFDGTQVSVSSNLEDTVEKLNLVSELEKY